VDTLLSYAVLGYVSQTVGNVFSRLIPLKASGLQSLVRQWTATGTGVALAFTGKVDMLADMGMDFSVEPLGYIVTGLIVGHGLQYTINFFTNLPKKT
jgi:hypothetical protein